MSEIGAVYFGKVRHRRLRPVGHRFEYKVFSLLLDLDAMDDARLRLLSKNRFNLFSFFECDFGSGRGQPLAAEIRALMRENGVDASGPLRLLFYPRILGFAFNPLAVFYCTDRSGAPSAMLYEVRNTFGEKHAYLIPVEGAGAVIRQEADKQFYVSPFIGMAQRYRFSLTTPDEAIAVAIRQGDAQGPVLDASFTGRRRRLDDRTLLRAFLGHPLMTVKVVAAIHWEAAKLLVKGVKYVPQTERHTGLVTVVRAATPSQARQAAASGMSLNATPADKIASKMPISVHEVGAPVSTRSVSAT